MGRHRTLPLTPPRSRWRRGCGWKRLLGRRRGAVGGLVGAVAVFSDLSRVKELEHERRRAERLASMEAIASGMVSLCEALLYAYGAGLDVEAVLDTIGDTPCIRINALAPKGVTIYVKAEAFNPGGSVKDRIGLAIDPISGEDLQDLAAKIFATPKDFVEKVKDALVVFLQPAQIDFPGPEVVLGLLRGCTVVKS